VATNVTIGGDGSLFVGEDKLFELELLDTTGVEVDENGVPVNAAEGVPVDMSGWTLVFDIRARDNSPDPAIVSKVPTISGTYNVSRAVNTQRAHTSLTDTDTNLFQAKTYRQSWKRMNDGSETVLSRGDWAPEKATAP
jgi:hypothetical protein